MTTTFTRRQVLKGGAAAAAAGVTLFGRVGSAFGLAAVDPSTRYRNRLVVIFLAGGNDGLNTVAPIADVTGAPRRSVYDKVRPSIGYAADRLLPLDRPGDADHQLGLNPVLTNLKGMYDQGRVSVIQGVDYPDHSYSHFASTDIWQSGVAGQGGASGWLGRHLDRVGVAEGEVRGLAASQNLPLILRGEAEQGVNISALPLSFRDGNQSAAHTIARHNAARVFATWPSTDSLRHAAGANAAGTVDLVDTVKNETPPEKTRQKLVDQLLVARVLLEGDATPDGDNDGHPDGYGCEVVHVQLGGFDSHASQHSLQENGLSEFDYAIQTFFDGDGEIPGMDPQIAERTLIMVYTEFGRRIGQNNSGGTDHGAATPVFLIAGPPTSDTSPTNRLVGAIHGDHPDLGSVALPADNLGMTTDMRAVNQTVLTDWLNDPEPDPSYPTEPIPGVFNP